MRRSGCLEKTGGKTHQQANKRVGDCQCVAYATLSDGARSGNGIRGICEEATLIYVEGPAQVIHRCRPSFRPIHVGVPLDNTGGLDALSFSGYFIGYYRILLLSLYCTILYYIFFPLSLLYCTKFMDISLLLFLSMSHRRGQMLSLGVTWGWLALAGGVLFCPMAAHPLNLAEGLEIRSARGMSPLLSHLSS
jgi:hypothetical protein